MDTEMKDIDMKNDDQTKEKGSLMVNLSNHPSDTWCEAQIESARKFGKIVDLPFPMVDPTMEDDQLSELVKRYIENVMTISGHAPCTVHVMGEMTFTYRIVSALKLRGYNCVASTSERIVEALEDGSKNVKFEFCKFRNY